MASIFISYRREDSLAYTRHLHHLLVLHFGAPHQVFMDLDTLQPGEDFIDTIQQTVASCDVLIAVIGPHWLTVVDECGRPRLDNPEDFVRLEIQTALERRVRVIPALVAGASMPRSQDLPDALRALARRQAIHILDDAFNPTVNKLIESLDRALAATPASAPARPALQPGATRVNPKDGLTYVWIPPGRFMMGCSPGDTECFDDEKPPREVTIAEGFWLGQTSVTQEAYQRVMGENPSCFKGPKLPVETVNWNQAVEYCQKAGGRLPTEQEWEYAARAGSTEGRYGPLDEVAWYSVNSQGATHPVGSKKASAWGVYDMLGNVWEWTSSDYNAETKVVRGGSWNVDAGGVRASYRSRLEPTNRVDYLGFRCVGD